MKALGVVFDNKLKWNHHLDFLKERLIGLFSGSKIISNKLTLEQSTTVVTMQLLGLVLWTYSLVHTISEQKTYKRSGEDTLYIHEN